MLLEYLCNLVGMKVDGFFFCFLNDVVRELESRYFNIRYF